MKWERRLGYTLPIDGRNEGSIPSVPILRDKMKDDKFTHYFGKKCDCYICQYGRFQKEIHSKKG